MSGFPEGERVFAPQLSTAVGYGSVVGIGFAFALFMCTSPICPPAPLSPGSYTDSLVFFRSGNDSIAKALYIDGPSDSRRILGR